MKQEFILNVAHAGLYIESNFFVLCSRVCTDILIDSDRKKMNNKSNVCKIHTWQLYLIEA